MDTNESTIALNHKDKLIAAVLGLLTFALLCTQLHVPGVTWDEGLVNFAAAKNQADWFRNFFTLEAPFSKDTIEQYWFTTSDHPSLTRTMAALSHIVLSGWVDEIVAMRVSSALMFSVLIASIYLFLREFICISSSVFGALALIFMPRIWGHAHIFSLDLPIMCWWFWTTVTAYWVLAGRWNPVWFGVVFAISFTTKLHAAFLPFPILLWALFVLIQNKEDRILLLQRIVWSILWAAVLTPIIYIGCQPWLWHDTFTRIVERFTDYKNKSAVPLFYLGQLYVDSPWHYPFVMVVATVPASVFLIFIIGLLSPVIHRLLKLHQQSKSDYALHLLLFLMFLAPLLIIQLKHAYDGCRLFLPCFPLLAVIAAMGFSIVINTVQKYWQNHYASWGLIVVLLIMPAYSLFHYHPFYLAYFNEFVGGIRGAKEKGFETVYWCDALTPDFIEQLNEVLPGDKTAHPKSMEHKIIDYYIERGILKPTFKDYPWSYALLQSRQGMFTGEEWTLYHQRRPILVQELDGVQLYGLYALE